MSDMSRALKRALREVAMIHGGEVEVEGLLRLEWPADSAGDGDRPSLQAELAGPPGSPYADGHFLLTIGIHERYPIEPPSVRFTTAIYHPNVDEAGRICLDLLKMPPKGSWKPIIHLGIVLGTVRQLLAHPNPDDPLMADIAAEYRQALDVFHRKALEHTRLHAVKSQSTTNDVPDLESHIVDMAGDGVDATSVKKRPRLSELGASTIPALAEDDAHPPKPLGSETKVQYVSGKDVEPAKSASRLISEAVQIHPADIGPMPAHTAPKRRFCLSTKRLGAK